MKVTGYGSIDAPGGPVRRSGAAPAGSFASLLSAAEQADLAAAASEVGATGPLSSLLALQEVTEEEVRKKKLIQRGFTLLENLEQLRERLLMGTLSPHLLLTISQHMAQQKQQAMDPQLIEIIEDIELRVAVELAKIHKALADQGTV